MSGITISPDESHEQLEEVLVESLRLNALAPNRVLFLKSKQRDRYLPIIIGVPEADSIALALQGASVPRPLTHDLLLASYTALGARVTRVAVTRHEGETFFGSIFLEVAGEERSLDARPSDCFALAVRAGAPIYASTEVLDRCGIDVKDANALPGRVTGDFPPTERVQRVLLLAREEAQRFGRQTIGSEHLLLGLIAEGESLVARLLETAGLDRAGTRAAVAAVVGFGDATGPIKRTPEPANPALKTLAEEEAHALGHRWIGTEHVFLALLREQDGAAARVLTHLGVDTQALRTELLEAVRSADTQPPSGSV
jgi:uncharacterized protein